jgi:hypothetical protein
MPTLTSNGIAGYREAFDDPGNRTEIAYFGADGRPILQRDGYARLTVVYDELGWESESRYFDEQNRELTFEIVVRAAVPGSMAQRIELVPGDHLLSCDGRKLASVRQAQALIADDANKGLRSLTVRRGQQALSFEVPAGFLGVTMAMERVEAAASGP